MPLNVSFAAHAMIGKTGYMFGGWDGAKQLDTIIEVHLNGTSRLLDARLPYPRSNASAASDGTSIYLFGGANDEMMSNQALKFTPATGIERMCDRLPTPRTGVASHSFAPGTAVLFGGLDASGYLNETWRYTDAPCRPPPAISASFVWVACGLDVRFTAQSDGEPPMKWVWDFHDGTIARAQEAGRVFTQPGTYAVRLTVVDDDALTAQTHQEVTVPGPACEHPAPTTRATQRPTATQPAATDAAQVTGDSNETTSSGSHPTEPVSAGPGPGTGSAPSPAAGTSVAPGPTPGPGLGLVAVLVVLGAWASRSRPPRR